MVVVSLTLNWHWFADLIAGLLVGGVVLELTVAADAARAARPRSTAAPRGLGRGLAYARAHFPRRDRTEPRSLTAPSHRHATSRYVTALAATAVLVSGCGRPDGDRPRVPAVAGPTPPPGSGTAARPTAFGGTPAQSPEATVDRGRRHGPSWLLPASDVLPGAGRHAARGVVGTDVGRARARGHGQVVALADGRPRFAVSTASGHPRGGAQPHLFGVDGDTLAEVTVDGEPLLPFVATDGGWRP